MANQPNRYRADKPPVPPVVPGQATTSSSSLAAGRPGPEVSSRLRRTTASGLSHGRTPPPGRRPPGVSTPRAQTPAPTRHSLARTTSAPHGHHLPRFGLEFDDGSCVAVRGRGLIGRDPAVSEGADVVQLVRLVDESCAMSRTHLEFGVGESGLWIRDCASTNGSQIEIDGQRHAIQPGQRVPAPEGSTIHLGARRLWVRSTGGRVVTGRVTVDWGVATHAGPSHERNQDSYCADAPVFVVADGMGGHAAGDIASREMVRSMQALRGHTRVTRDMFIGAVRDARARIGRIPAGHGAAPGTTLSGVIVTETDDGATWMVVNIGDSRTYRLDSGGFKQLSIDHSVVQDLIHRGAIAASAAESLSIGNVLTRAVVAETEHAPDVWQLPLRPGDRVLVCSDGLTKTLNDATIAGVLRAMRDPLAAACDLVNAAVEAGGTDDATAMVIDAVAIGPA